MPVSLTVFVDFVSKSGTPKATVVRQWKNRGGYSVATDYYKRIRDAIVEFHQTGTEISDLAAGAAKHKRDNYRAVATGHAKWVGKKTLVWFEPPSRVWAQDGLEVSVNPELGLEVGGVPHLIKLYFKAEKLAKNRVDLITQLMRVTLRRRAPSGCVMGVLDLRNAKLITPTVTISGLSAQLKAEAAYWNTLWESI